MHTLNVKGDAKSMIYKSQTLEPITAQMNFIFRARMLFRDLALWLRSYKVSLFSGFGNLDETSRRLFRIPLEYGSILKLFFGEQDTEQLIYLLTQYISTLQSLFRAQYNNDVEQINSLTQQVYQNVNDTAAFLAILNPYWSQSYWVSLLNSFTISQINEATTFLIQEHSINIDIFDRIISLSNIIGDYFAEGLTNYFFLTQQPQET
jgi:hypothetical protein